MKIITLDAKLAEEVWIALQSVAEYPGIGEDMAAYLLASVPRGGGGWEVPDHLVPAVQSQVIDHCMNLKLPRGNEEYEDRELLIKRLLRLFEP